MTQLRPRERPVFSGFTSAEVERMEKLHIESGEQLMNKEICQKLARSFNSSGGRAGKPIIKWTEVQNWFDSRQQQSTSKLASSTDASRDESVLPKSCPSNTEKSNSQFPREAGNKALDPQVFEFEARSSKDGAWYDVEMFLTHRFIGSAEAFL